MSVVVIGSINRDLVCEVEALPRPGETVSAHRLRELPGGKGANQAVAAARMGVRVAMIGRTGADAGGTRLRETLVADGVVVDGIGVDPALPTGTAYIAIDRNGENQIIVDAGANAALGSDMIARNVFAGARVVLTQLETPVAAASRAFALAREVGALSMLNTAPALPKGVALFAAADVIVFNQIELAHYLGMDTVPTDPTEALAARRLLTRDDQSAVVTLGAAGAVLVTRTASHFAPGFRVAAVDTTGAGDCFCGALAALLAEGMALADALPLANAAAALCVQQLGAAPAMPMRAAVEAMALTGVEGARSTV